MSLSYYTISAYPMAAGVPWLMVDWDAQDPEILDALEAALRESSTLGRAALPAHRLTLRAELEGEEEDYGPDEIARSMEGVPKPYEAMSGRRIVCNDAFLQALDVEDVRYRAHPLIFEHPATKRSWSDFWLVTFSESRVVALLRDDAEPAFIGDTLWCVYYAERVKRRIEALGVSWLSFDKRELMPCTSMPLGDGADADRVLREAASEAFFANPPKVGPAYSPSRIMLALQLRYSDATPERLARAIDAEPDGDLFCERNADGAVTGFGVRTGSSLARRLETP